MSDPPCSVLDASSLMLLIKNLGDGLIPRLRSLLILDLTVYETGNALWKEGHLSKALAKEDAASLAEALEQVFSLLERTSTDPRSFGSILELARRERVTFYDASYLHAAIERKAVLVTKDARLRHAAKKYVETKAASDI